MSSKETGTQKFFKEAAKLKHMSFAQKLHAYIYGRWIYFYIAVGTGEHKLCSLFRPLGALLNKFSERHKNNEDDTTKIGFADTYHGKVITTSSARKLVTINKKIDLRNLEQIIPYKRAKDIVMLNPEFIVAMECPCRAARKNPCTPTDVCLIVGEPFASFILQHHATKARRITSEEAEEIIEQEHKRGHVHHAFFKDAMLDRFYAICNCCKCCCGAMQVFRGGTPMLSSSGYLCKIDLESCVGCGRCVKICQFEAIIQTEDKTITIDPEKCMGCGACISACKPEALSLERDQSQAPPLEIHKLMAQAAKMPGKNVIQ